MKKGLKSRLKALYPLKILFATFVLSGFVLTSSLALGEERDPPYVPGVLIVKFKSQARVNKTIHPNNTGISSIDRLNQKYGVRHIEKTFKKIRKRDRVGLDRIYKFYVDPKINPRFLATHYQLNENIEYAEPKYVPVPLSIGVDGVDGGGGGILPPLSG